MGNYETNKGRCYELALSSILRFDHPGDEEAVLVHGYPHLYRPGKPDDGCKYGHAWIEYMDGYIAKVYDPVTEETFQRDRYYSAGRIDERECHVYTREEAARHFVESRDDEIDVPPDHEPMSPGPWHTPPDDAIFGP
ncbi:MAG: hypothetical protein HQ567_34660 [Candidatus Nealsonbacteria bacterium]|nr:hypothetical protein [Candidatus Nealsonbacteria bacterium]